MGRTSRSSKTKEKPERPRFTRLRIISSSEDETNHGNDSSSSQRRQQSREASRSRSRSPIVIVHHDDASPCRRPSSHRSSRHGSAQPPLPVGANGALDDSISPQPEPGPSNAAIENDPEEVELDEDILLLLGDAPKNDTPLGPPIHKDIASRWQEILAKGLPKEVKEKILKEYIIPSNCDLLLAPELNPEAKAALSDVFVKRDTSIMNKQKQIGVALSALAKLTQLIVSNETSKQKLLKPLSDACRILCDSHQKETITRRNFVISSINTTLKDTLLEAERGKLLFGDNVGEKLKVAKNIQRSGEVLKNQQKPVFTKNNFAYKRGRLNYQQTHRKTNNKPSGDSARAAPPNQRQSPRSNSSYSNRGRKPTDHERYPQRRNYRR